MNLPKIVDASEFILKDIKRPPELIQGILHVASKFALGGPSKAYKTYSLADMGLSVAFGCPWWGFPTTKSKVLFMNFEIQGIFFQERLKEIQKAKGITLQQGDMDIWNLRGFSADLGSLTEQIVDRIARSEYQLIIVDPLYKLLGARDENSASNMAELLNHLEGIAVKSGAAVAFGSHFSKGNQAAKESIDRISGSGVFARDPDSILTLTRHQEEDAFTVDLTLRNFPPQEPFVIRRNHPLMIKDASLDPSRLKKSGGRPSEYSAQDLLDLLTKPMKSREWEAEAKDNGIASASFYRLLKELKASKQIGKGTGSNHWVKV
jgi:hypothetical protein